MEKSVADAFGGRVRVRACGVSIKNDSILLIGLRGLIEGELYWSAPGGGVHYGEDARDTVRRETLEETGLIVHVGRFMFLRQHVRPPLHAIELYFEAKVLNDTDCMKKGSDPELSADNQLISEVRYMTLSEIKALPSRCVDPILQTISTLDYLGDELNWPAIQKQLI